MACVDTLLEDNPDIKEAIDAGNFIVTAYDIASFDTVDTPEDMIRFSATFLSIFDPTGISSVVAAYTYPVCSAYFPNN